MVCYKYSIIIWYRKQKMLERGPINEILCIGSLLFSNLKLDLVQAETADNSTHAKYN